MNDNGKQSEEGGEERGDLRERLDGMNRIATELKYNIRNFNQKYLLCAELLTTYAEKLELDGRLSEEAYRAIYSDIRLLAGYIKQTVSESTGEFELIQGK